MNNHSIKILVTGGAGFIGSTTVDTLLARNLPVRVLDNFNTGRRQNLDTGNPLLEVAEGDVRDGKIVDHAMQGVSHCLHLAAQVSVTASLEDPVASANENIVGFLTVLEAARAHALQRFVYASSAAVYGHPESIPLDESSRLAPLSPYGLEKKVNEDYARLYAELYQLPSLGLRYFNVYGPRQDPQSPYAGVITLFVNRILHGQGVTVFGDGEQSRDFIYVKEVAETNCVALIGDLSGACNVGTGKKTNLLQLIEVISRLTNQTIPTEFAPARAGDINHSLADVTRMENELGFSANTTIETGLREYIENR